MLICALYRSSIRRSSWSPTGNCRCDSACIERPVPRTLSCLRITTNSAICARSFSVTSLAISPGLWCRSRTSKRCCNRPRCQCRNPLVKCSKVRLTLYLSLFCMLYIKYIIYCCLFSTRAELNATSVEDNDFYIRESRDMVTVIQTLLQAGEFTKAGN